MLRFGGLGMIELFQSSVFVTWNAEVDFTICVVPLEVDANVPAAIPFAFDGVILFKDALEMFGVLFSNVFYSKIINYKCKLYRTPFVCP